jgi:hypothetical protein
MAPRSKTTKTTEPAPPGGTWLELRVDGKVQFRQPVHTYDYQLDDDKVVITGVVRLPITSDDDNT